MCCYNINVMNYGNVRNYTLGGRDVDASVRADIYDMATAPGES